MKRRTADDSAQRTEDALLHRRLHLFRQHDHHREQHVCARSITVAAVSTSCAGTSSIMKNTLREQQAPNSVSDGAQFRTGQLHKVESFSSASRVDTSHL